MTSRDHLVRTVAAGVSGACLAFGGLLATVDAAAGAAAAAPDLTGVYYRGLYMKPPEGVEQDVVLPVDGVIPGMFGPGPITPITGVLDPQKHYALGDFRSPLLRPRAAAAVKAHNDDIEAGRMSPPPSQACQPSGLFMQLTNPGAVKITQRADQIVMQFQSDGAERVIHLNAQHPAAVMPSLYGHSVGRWEGDTLVVDTVGLDEKMPLDRYGTPHTAGLHVVERIRLFKARMALEDHVYGEDFNTFAAPWWGVVTFRRQNEPFTTACAAR
jgi:hypothetical protein